MNITYETNRDETRYTFYALDMGDVFSFEEDGGACPQARGTFAGGCGADGRNHPHFHAGCGG